MRKWSGRFILIALISLFIHGWKDNKAHAIDGFTLQWIGQQLILINEELVILEANMITRTRLLETAMGAADLEGAAVIRFRLKHATARWARLMRVRDRLNSLRIWQGASHGPRGPRAPRGPGGGPRRGFITPKGLGVLVAVELTIVATELSIEFRHEVFSFAEDPDFEYVNEVEESLVTLNVFSGGYWQGFGSYYSGYLPWNWGG